MKYIVILILCGATTISYGQKTVSPTIIISREGQLPADVSDADLRVEVDNKPATVVSLTSLAGAHLQYVLLNDESRRTEWPGGIKEQTDVADEFLKRVISAGSDTGTLVNFANDVFLDVQNEKEPKKLSAKLDRVGKGRTQLYDAVVSSANWLAKQPVSADQRKVMFLFSDGDDDASKTSLAQATKALQRTTTPIFIFAPSSVESKKEGATLRQIAREAGGRVYFMPRNGQHVSFDLLNHDLAESFLLKISVSSAAGMLPFAVSDKVNSQVSITAPSQIAVP
jgi:hypothetical protein